MCIVARVAILSAGHRETFEPACVCFFFLFWLSACLVVTLHWLRFHDRLILNQWYWSLHNLVSCVCSMCMHPCLCVRTCVCRGQRLPSGVFLYGFPPYFLRQPFSLNMELTDPARVAGYWVPGSSCLYPVNDRIRRVHYPTWLFMWVLGPT